MNEKVKLPSLDLIDADYERACDAGWIGQEPKLLAILAGRERQLREALAQIAALTKQVEELTQAIEHDRTSLCSPLESMRKALESREWLRLGRGSYEWNDDRWRDEFAEACNEIYAAIEPLQKVASDWTHCSRDGKLVESARINWKARAESAQDELAAARRTGEYWKAEHNAANAELAALREGATVTWRVDRAMLGGVEQEWNNLSEFEARAIYDQVLKWPDNKSVTLRELTTRERILDTTEHADNNGDV